MHARAVRFTGVNDQTIANVRAQVEESDGPPPGVKATAMKMLYDADQGTALFVAFFANEEDMREADRVFDEMDTGDTNGARASDERSEVLIEREA